MKFRFLFLLFILCFVIKSQAGIRPSFSLEYSSWYATHIAVVTEGEKIDGQFEVVEPIKGDLGYRQKISVPAFAQFESESSRQVKEWDTEKPLAEKYVSGSKMILFLIKDSETDSWKPVNIFKDWNTSVLWIENEDKIFAFIQTINPGSSILVEYGVSESKIKNDIYQITDLRNSLDNTLKIENKYKRAEGLERFLVSDFYLAKQNAFEEIEKCGDAALPVLRKILGNKSFLKIHDEVIESFAKAGGAKTGKEIAEIFREENKFWRKTAPFLKKGWWNNLDDPELETLRSHYGKTLEIIRQFNNLKYKESVKEVTLFRNFWRSLPQLEDSSGLDQMSEECDDFLKSISTKKQKI